MAKALPSSIDLSTAVKKEWQLQGELLLADLKRMPTELIASTEALVKYEILFKHSKTVLGEAVIRIESDLELICQRSLETFEFALLTDSVIGFINEMDDEDKLAVNVSPSWVENMQVNPKVLLEDEILLMIPDIPLKPGAELNSQYLSNQSNNEPETKNKQNPFAALEQLKGKN